MEYNLQQRQCEIVVQPSQGELIWNPQKLGDTSRYLVFISNSYSIEVSIWFTRFSSTCWTYLRIDYHDYTSMWYA